MHFSARFVAAALAALPVATAWPAELTRTVRGFCESEPSADLLALHDNIVGGDQATLDMIAKGEAIIQDALAKAESGLHGSSEGMTVTKRDNGNLITLDAWFHVVYSSKTAKGGYLTASNIQDQLNALNKAFDPSNLAFNLVNTTYTQNAAWADTPAKNGNEATMKRKLHKGDSRTLNLYLLPGYDVNGKCTFPNPRDPYEGDVLLLDGCLVGSFTLPGNDNVFNKGLTAVHEVGHWLGLLHTFTDGCDESNGGDKISDTPAEETANYGECPANRDTCPDLPGLDPIDNYMDYSSDACYSRFTPEQIKRMRSILSAVRLGSSS